MLAVTIAFGESSGWGKLLARIKAWTCCAIKRATRRIRPVEQDEELFAAKSDRRRARERRACDANAIADLLQAGIARLMAIGVVI